LPERATQQKQPGITLPSFTAGFGGYLGNKGAVAARMRVHDAAVLFVASHLASGDAEGDELRRNADVAEILRRCTFSADQQPSE
jgi:phosphatidylinositol-bisphosphatase